MKKLPRTFFARPTLWVARNLLRKTLVRKTGARMIRATITETEAYIGERDKASHASRGRTQRTETMFLNGGYAYVYLIYGMHWCFNIVTEHEGFPSAVLIRGIEINGQHISGPGRTCKALNIDKNLNGADLIGNRELWIEEAHGLPTGSSFLMVALKNQKRATFGDHLLGMRKGSPQIRRGPRIGVDYAGSWAKKPWRFWLKK